jgi:hypothetical protein
VGIDRESDVAADLQIGPTSLGRVRIFVSSGAVEIAMDFDPEEAEEIAEELRAAAERARHTGAGPKQPKGGAPGGANRGGNGGLRRKPR